MHNNEHHDPASRRSRPLAWIVAALGVTAATLATGGLVAAAFDGVRSEDHGPTIDRLEGASATSDLSVSRLNWLFDPIELDFLTARPGDSSTEDVPWFLDPVELDFITGRGGWR